MRDLEGTCGRDEWRSADDLQRLDEAERENFPLEIVCEQCGRVCKALGRPVAPRTIIVMPPEVAMTASRYCDGCNIIVCGGCTGVSPSSSGYRTGGRPCPRCGAETVFAAVLHLRLEPREETAISVLLQTASESISRRLTTGQN